MQSIEGETESLRAYLNLNDVFQEFLVRNISSAVKTSRLSERKSFYSKTQAALFLGSRNEKRVASKVFFLGKQKRENMLKAQSSR